VNALGTHRQPFASKEDSDSPIPVARVLPSDPVPGLQRGSVAQGKLPLVAQSRIGPRPLEAKEGALQPGRSNDARVRLQRRDGFVPLGRRTYQPSSGSLSYLPRKTKMLYQLAYDHLVQSVEAETIRRGHRAGTGRVLVDLHLDERFYAMPIQVDVAAQRALLNREGAAGDLVERLAEAVAFEDLSRFSGVLRVFARTLLNRAGVGDLLRGHAEPDANARRHIVPRVGRVLDAIAGAPDQADLTDYDTLLGLIEAAATAHVDQDGPKGILADDLETIRALQAEGIAATRLPVKVVVARCGSWGWVRWTRGLHSGLRCLSAVSGLNRERFEAAVAASIADGQRGPLDLGLRFEASVQEMGLALAMSFFGDLGYPQFAKPDRHVVKALCAYEGRKLSARDAFERLVWHSTQAGVTPRRLDKVFYLAGSGNFYQTGFDFGPAFKTGFLEHLRQAGGQPPA
jgi:hypothetical protein